MSFTRQLATVLAVVVLSTAQATTIYVDVNCPGPGNGSEVDPYCSIQTAIDNAVDTDEIVVAPGTYFEAINFLGKAITLRSVGGPDVTIIDAGGVGLVTVVTCESGEGPGTVLEGFTLTGGTGMLIEIFLGVFRVVGGGMLNIASNPTVIDCTFSGNTVIDYGAGMYNGSSNPTITGCTFIGNTAYGGGGMRNYQSNPTMTNCTFSGNLALVNGGGMVNYESSPTITDCTFTGNMAQGSVGGAITSILYGSPTVTNCTFTGNSANRSGGGMWCGPGSPTVTNCTFDGNTAGQDGGGMFILYGSPTITDCTFSGNTAANGNAIAVGTFAGDLVMTNCILWNGGDEIFIDIGPSVTINYSDVKGGFPGIGNIDADPLFVDPDNGDYRLSAGSPCIDAGDNTAVPEGVLRDLDGNPRFVADACSGAAGQAVDIGAYEFQGTSCDLGDMLTMLAAWGRCDDCGACPSDFDGDCSVDILDLLILLGNLR